MTLRIVIWNCNMALHKKVEPLMNDLEKLGFDSAYHQFENCRYGEEPEPTHYWRMSTTQVYHIDYCFVPNDWFHKRLKVTLGRPEQWLCFSDHVPLVVEV